MTSSAVPIAVLISGRGSNLVALAGAIESGEIPARIALVLSNESAAAGLVRAREMDLEAVAVPHRDFSSRAAHEAAVLERLEAASIEWVCLAGYTRLLSPDFVGRYRNRMLNIHPSLLPAFPGLEVQQQAIDHGVKLSGCTVHLVDEGLDSGPIVLQCAVPVRGHDTAAELAARILEQEHRAYPEALRKLLVEPWAIEGRRVFLSSSIGVVEGGSD